MEKITGKTVLITGGAGFIGSNLCEDFLNNNNKVICLDNFSTGHHKNILEFLANPYFTLIEGDISDLDTCRHAVKGVDYVLHQAALGSVPRSIKNPIITNNSNINGFLNMLVAARDQGVKRFVYAASSSTYGDSMDLPKTEEIIGKPLSPYAVTKYINELYAYVFKGCYGMNVVGLRYFNVFGRRQDPYGAYAAVIPKFVMLLMNHKSPVINGDGTNSRDFTYIDNIIQLNHLAAANDRNEVQGQVFNAAGGQRTSLNKLTEILKEELSAYDPKIKDIKTKYGPERPGDIPHSHACIDKPKNLLGYTPQFTFEQGIKEAVKWYHQNLITYEEMKKGVRVEK